LLLARASFDRWVAGGFGALTPAVIALRVFRKAD